MVIDLCQQLNLLGTRSAEKRIIDYEHIATTLIRKRSNFMDNSKAQLKRKLTPVDTAGVHETVKRIFGKGERGQSLFLLLKNDLLLNAFSKAT